MAYALENALFQWRDGDRRLAETPEPSTFLLEELADLYQRDTDWATELAARQGAGTDAAAVVDAAFARYARESSNFAGVRPRESHARP